MASLKYRYRAWRDKPKRVNRRIGLPLAIAIVVLSILVYVFLSSPGQLIQQSFQKTFDPTFYGKRHIEVYSGSAKVKEYVGNYSIEKYQGYIVIMDLDTHKRTDVYGASVIVNDPCPENNNN